MVLRGQGLPDVDSDGWTASLNDARWSSTVGVHCCGDGLSDPDGRVNSSCGYSWEVCGRDWGLDPTVCRYALSWYFSDDGNVVGTFQRVD